MAEDERRNPILAGLSLLCMAALQGLPFLTLAPNRLVSGEPIYFFSAAPGIAWATAAALLGLGILSFFKPSRPVLVAISAVALGSIPALLWLAAQLASISLQSQSPIARVSLSSSFWVAITLSGFIVHSALQQLRAKAFGMAAAPALLCLALGIVFASGVASNLSLIKEYAVRADSFGEAVARHLQIVWLASAFTLAISLPLAWFAHVRPAVAKAVFAVLNIVQTIPSIALFGLLMLPLALLALSLPALGRAGISGVGLAPAVIALTLYGLLPVMRSALAGLQRVPASMVKAALALGLTRFQVLVAIELPLALPIALGGVRVAVVASIGLAAVSALIGAGGLGGILFEGLFSNAQDVVLLGVLPIIALGVFFDAVFKGLIAWTRRMALPRG